MDITERVNDQTHNQADINYSKVAKLFPNAVTETIDKKSGKVVRAINKDILQQEISNYVVDGSDERYELTWPDKRKAILLANLPIDKTLRPSVEESVDFENTHNLYIEGDNLDALKLLQESYLGKVDVIYVDPPYNTGTSLVYHNDFFEDPDDYLKNTSGQFDKDGNRLVCNIESNGRFHTDWLNMMYPRLRIAKNLLKSSGIFVLTIDDYEVNTIMTVLNEIFGESNHLATVVIKNNPSGRSTVKGFSVNHEYALFYSRSDEAELGRMKHSDIQRARYKEHDDIGYFEWENFRKNGTDSDRNDRPKQFFPIVLNTQTNKLRIPKIEWNAQKREYNLIDTISNMETMLLPKTPTGAEKVWKYGIERTKAIINDILVKKTNNGYELYRKKYFNDAGILPHTWWDKPDYSARDNGTRELTNLFGPGKVFDFPKAPTAVRDSLITANLKDDGIVLDFFSGSATTAQATMQLNAEDNGRRKFIMVQLPEKTDKNGEAYKSGYKNICDVGKERIRRVAKKLYDENPDKKLDFGFRVLKIDSANKNTLVRKPLGEIRQEDLSLEINNIKSNRTSLDLLFEVISHSALPLDLPFEQDVIGSSIIYKYGYYGDGTGLIGCFDDDVAEDAIKEIAKMKPLMAAFRDSSFKASSDKINLSEHFRVISPETRIKIL